MAPCPQLGTAAPDPKTDPPVCCPVHLRALPNIPRNKLSYAPLLLQKNARSLLCAFQAAPQFARVPVPLLFQQRRNSLRVLLLGGCAYYAQQAALYLASLSRLEYLKTNGGHSENDGWAMLENLLDETSEPELNPLADALSVVSPALLDGSLSEDRPKESPVAMVCGGQKQGFRLLHLNTPAILLAAPSGPVLTSNIMEQITDLVEQNMDQQPPDLFIALQPEQVDLEFLEELRFSFGFHVCRLGLPDQNYLRRFLRQTAKNLFCPLDEQADLDQIIAQARRCRGNAFNETDLEKLIAWAVQRQTTPPLRTQDLIFTPFQDKKTAWNELQEMIGLDPVKDALRRRLAAAALESRRRQKGLTSEPMYHNLAFSGPPGTGKSVTARLAARILREEGCGTGRFVEAGREQLIGTYMGQTSPMIADLFRRAKGGVLFLDEAGALLDRGRGDSYAVEAVNALVRHMELEPETMVIFATYPGEMEQLFRSNPGLSSRVSQTLDFPGYDDQTLWKIFQNFARKDGCPLPEDAEEICLAFFAQLRRRKKDEFGNGREARRLYQGAVEEMALAVLDDGRQETLTRDDLERAAQRLLICPEAKTRAIGFS